MTLRTDTARNRTRLNPAFKRFQVLPEAVPVPVSARISTPPARGRPSLQISVAAVEAKARLSDTRELLT